MVNKCSHAIRVYRGLIFCNKCGSISRYSKLGNLATICEPPKEYGKGNLSRLSKGLLPINVDSWPSDAEYGTQYNLREMLGDIDPEHLDTMEAWAYEFHQFHQQLQYSPPLSLLF